MKNRETIRDLLGLTQAELGLVLNVTRSQFSKYELGLRDLPLAAKYLLAEMLHHMRDSETSLKEVSGIEDQNHQKQLTLECMLKENQYQLMKVERKINVLQKKYDANLNALQLIQFLNSHPINNNGEISKKLNVIASRVNQNLKINGLRQLIVLQGKEQFLQRQQEWLKTQIPG